SASTPRPHAATELETLHESKPRPALASLKQPQLPTRLGPRWRPGAAKGSGDVVGAGDGRVDANASTAASTGGDVDFEDTGEELCPGEASRRGVGPSRQEALAEAMAIREHAVVADEIEAGGGTR